MAEIYDRASESFIETPNTDAYRHLAVRDVPYWVRRIWALERKNERINAQVWQEICNERNYERRMLSGGY